MAFTLDPTTDRGKVRLLIGDTDTDTLANQIFTDAEIDAFLSLENSEVYSAAAAAAESIASSSARSAIFWRAHGSDIQMDKRSVPKHFRGLAEKWRERATMGAPSEEIDSLDYVISDVGEDKSEYVGDVI